MSSKGCPRRQPLQYPKINLFIGDFTLLSIQF